MEQQQQYTLSPTKPMKPKYKQREVTPIRSVFNRSLITKNIMLPIVSVGKNVKQTIEKTISNMVEQKCIVEGYVKPGSIKVITYSSGLIKGDNILFDVVFTSAVLFQERAFLFLIY